MNENGNNYHGENKILEDGNTEVKRYNKNKRVGESGRCVNEKEIDR